MAIKPSKHHQEEKFRSLAYTSDRPRIMPNCKMLIKNKDQRCEEATPNAPLGRSYSFPPSCNRKKCLKRSSHILFC